MDSLEQAINLVTKNCFFASLDLKDAYYSIPIHQSFRKYLRFLWKGEKWQFKALPNGLTSGPRIFTKILKVPMSIIRSIGHEIVAYIDDTLVIAETQSTAKQAVSDTVRMLQQLGFVIHPTKSVLIPTHKIEFLGFVIDSSLMTITLTQRKIEQITEFSKQIMTSKRITIRQLACYIGKVVASFPGAEYGKLHYRELEREKIKYLAINRGNFEAKIKISICAREEARWWYMNVGQVVRNIHRQNPGLTLESDASGLGWGGSNGITHIGGRWGPVDIDQDSIFNINQLELKAAFLMLQSFCNSKRDIHVRLKLDNTTAIAYINNMGGTKSKKCNDLAKNLWEWCIQRNIWVTAVHLPGLQNIVADKMSRQFEDELEWKLDPKIFLKLNELQGQADIDLFASRLNTQLPKYVSWYPDPGAIDVDAFSLNWNRLNFYAFPPFCVVGRCIQKIIKDKAEGILIVPNWPTQAWFAKLLKILIDNPIVIIRGSFKSRGVPDAAVNILLASWLTATKSQYGSYINRWCDFCSEQQTRSALSSFVTLEGNIPISNHPLVSRFMKGVFNLKPPQPRYNDIWNAGDLLKYLRTLQPTCELRLRDLTYKLVALITLITASRIQTVHLLRIDNMIIENDYVEFRINELIKQSRPGYHGQRIRLDAYQAEDNLCIVNVLKCYLAKTALLRKDEQQLLISYRKPHDKVSKDTIARWIKTILLNSGIDSKYKPHSVRAAAASAANTKSVPVTQIMLNAGWTSEHTFRKFYNKPVLVENSEFQEAILKM
ncbi:uncharacterized protein [Antedon mediterranea]|uniref:uncharacterized protein n=1 Tax=Antedon mediterranea TaxID=105859 RepID=UPI003AF6A3D8